MIARSNGRTSPLTASEGTTIRYGGARTPLGSRVDAAARPYPIDDHDIRIAARERGLNIHGSLTAGIHEPHRKHENLPGLRDAVAVPVAGVVNLVGMVCQVRCDDDQRDVDLLHSEIVGDVQDERKDLTIRHRL